MMVMMVAMMSVRNVWYLLRESVVTVVKSIDLRAKLLGFYSQEAIPVT